MSPIPAQSGSVPTSPLGMPLEYVVGTLVWAAMAAIGSFVANVTNKTKGSKLYVRIKVENVSPR